MRVFRAPYCVIRNEKIPAFSCRSGYGRRIRGNDLVANILGAILPAWENMSIPKWVIFGFCRPKPGFELYIFIGLAFSIRGSRWSSKPPLFGVCIETRRPKQSPAHGDLLHCLGLDTCTCTKHSAVQVYGRESAVLLNQLFILNHKTLKYTNCIPIVY